MTAHDRPGEDATNTQPPNAPLDDFELALGRAAPAEPPADGCTLDPPFDAGLIGAWLDGRGADGGADGGAEAVDDRVAAHLADCAGCRALLPHLAEPLLPGLVARLVDEAAPARRRRWPWAAGGAVVALAAGLMLAVSTPTRPPPPGFEAGPLQGGVAISKSAPTVSSTFVPTSRLRWVLRPPNRLAGTLPVAAFESAPPGAPLRRLPDAAAMRDGGAVVLDASAGALFGDRYGPRTLYVAVAVEAAALADAVGGDPPDAGPDVAVDGVRWYRVGIDYRAE